MSDPGDVNRFYCHCCRDSFLKPICPPADNRFTKMLGAVILLAAMLAGGGSGIILLGLSGLAMFWGAEIRSRLPSVCPVCHSTNFSRQPKAADEKK
jgi:transposase-like protein